MSVTYRPSWLLACTSTKRWLRGSVAPTVALAPFISLSQPSSRSLPVGWVHDICFDVLMQYRPEECTVKAAVGDSVHVHYQGTLSDGTEFDSSYSRGTPFVFTLGKGQVIKGWDQGILGMCPGEKRKLKIPPSLGYGDAGAPPKIPGGAALIFHTELVKIDGKEQ
ncbi:unnamed protein product [Ostreobium quekettii]|uniref:peptidylprolyl isomerase n=1 Tax=Ostreobium quekettii TaxID=121088 RepID=A0A8S1J099_9CHLO|nr:unnamed protein product [Ostreobium quekettii]